MKIFYVPLDERPCNALYPKLTAEISQDVQVIPAPKELLGKKKTPANIEAVWSFVEENIGKADAAVLSGEMLLYGGLLPSRLHHFEEAKLMEYKQRIVALKEKNPQVKLYFSNLIMRTPRYSSDDEEPDYYGTYGQEIFRYGWLKDREQRGEQTKEEAEEFTQLSSYIPAAVVEDYETRRAFNVKGNLLHIQLVNEGIIDFLSIPQDDSAPYGYTAADQKIVYGEILKKNLKDKIMVYPGADEVGFTLLARSCNEIRKRKPKVYVRYSSTLGPTIIPLYEDRIMNESLKAHIMAAGMELEENYEQADIVLAYNTPGKVMQEAAQQYKEKDITYDTFRHLPTFVHQIAKDIEKGKLVGICDSAFANGGDLELIQMLDKQGLLEKICCYKAWNTNCNSLGSSLSALTFSCGDSNQQKIKESILANIFEDVFYQGKIRSELTDSVLPDLGLNYFDLKDQSAHVLDLVKERMHRMQQDKVVNSFCKEKLTIHLASPWNRMFEIECTTNIE